MSERTQAEHNQINKSLCDLCTFDSLKEFLCDLFPFVAHF